MVRVSGPATRAIAEALLGKLPPPRIATFARFRAVDGAPIDEGLALYFPAPRSYTGEDVLELHGHGGPVVLDMLLARALALGARQARPGEFTERAFLNGKLDLAQAEAVADLIDAGSQTAARAALRSLDGEFSRRVQALTEQLIQLRLHRRGSDRFSGRRNRFPGRRKNYHRHHRARKQSGAGADLGATGTAAARRHGGGVGGAPECRQVVAA